MRISIHKGLYVQYREISDPHSMLGEPYDTILEYQVYDENGNPISSSYRGDAHVSNGVIVIGDPLYQANLTELRIDPEPTFDSIQRFYGFMQAIDEKRRPSSKGLAKYENKSTQWWDGYREGWAQKDQRKKDKREREKNPQQIANDFVSRHANDVTWEQRIPGGTTRPPCEFDRDALVAGLQIELEHTTDPGIAMEIAMDHLDRDPSHYDKTPERRARARNPSALPASSREARISRRVRGA